MSRAKERFDDDVAAVGEIEKGVLAYMSELRDRVVLETSIGLCHAGISLLDVGRRASQGA